MGLLDRAVEALLRASTNDWENRYEREAAAARTRALKSVSLHLPKLVEYLRELDDYSDMLFAGRVPLVQLGQLDTYPLPGFDYPHRMLYLGSDGNFYVFGPVDFDRRIDKDSWFGRYNGANGKPVTLAMLRLKVDESTDYALVTRVNEHVVSAFI